MSHIYRWKRASYLVNLYYELSWLVQNVSVSERRLVVGRYQSVDLPAVSLLLDGAVSRTFGHQLAMVEIYGQQCDRNTTEIRPIN